MPRFGCDCLSRCGQAASVKGQAHRVYVLDPCGVGRLRGAAANANVTLIIICMPHVNARGVRPLPLGSRLAIPLLLRRRVVKLRASIKCPELSLQPPVYEQQPAVVRHRGQNFGGLCAKEVETVVAGSPCACVT